MASTRDDAGDAERGLARARALTLTPRARSGAAAATHRASIRDLRTRMDALIRRDDDDDDDDDGGDASDGGLKPTPSTTWMAALAREFAAIGNRGTLAEGLGAMRARQLEQARARRQTAAWRSGAQLCASTCVCFATFFTMPVLVRNMPKASYLLITLLFMADASVGAMVRKSFNRVAGTIGGALTGSVFLYVVDAVGGQWKQNLAGAILSGGIMMFGRFHMAKSPKTGYAWLIFMLTFLIVVNDGWKVVAGDNVISHSFETALWRTVHVALGCVIIVVTSCVVFPNYARKTLRLQTGVIVGSLSSAYHALTMNHISEGDDIREVKLDECVAIAKSISAAQALLYPASAEVYLRESVRRQYFQTTAWTNLLKELMRISSVITALQVNTMDEEFVGVASEDEELREILVSLSRWIVESLLIVKMLLTHSTSSLMFHDLTLSARIRRAVLRRTSREASRIERRREQSFLAPLTTNLDRSIRYAGVLSASLDAYLNEWTVVTTVVGEDDADGIATTKPPVVVPVLSLADRSVAASARVERRVRHLRAHASASRTVIAAVRAVVPILRTIVGADVRVGVGRSIVDRSVVPPASS